MRRPRFGPQVYIVCETSRICMLIVTPLLMLMLMLVLMSMLRPSHLVTSPTLLPCPLHMTGCAQEEDEGGHNAGALLHLHYLLKLFLVVAKFSPFRKAFFAHCYQACLDQSLISLLSHHNSYPLMIILKCHQMFYRKKTIEEAVGNTIYRG